MYDTEVKTNLPNRRTGISLFGLLGAVWGITGVVLLLAYTIVRLAPIAIETFSYPLLWYHWAALVITLLLMAYLEGYKGFQRGFSPRVVARANYLVYHPKVLHVLLGPLFCMGYFYVSKKRRIVVIALTTGIAILVMLVRLLNQPWRGIVDAGVVVGLSWGLVSMLIFTVSAITLADFNYSPEVPE